MAVYDMTTQGQPRTRFGEVMRQALKPEMQAGVILPALDILESIATKGKGGAVARQQQAVKSGMAESARQRERERQLALQEEERRAEAAQRQLQEQFREEVGGLDPQADDFEASQRQIAQKYLPEEYMKGLMARKEPKAPTPSVTLTLDQLPGETVPQKLATMEQWQQATPNVKFTLRPEGESLADQIAKAMALQGAKAGAERALPAGKATEIGAVEESVDQLDKLMARASELKTLTFTPLDKARALNPWDTDVIAFNQMVASTKQVIGKGLEGGVLRKEDEFKYEKIIPRLGDTREGLNAKYQQLRNMLGSKHKNLVRSLGRAGFRVGEFTPIPQAASQQPTTGQLPSFNTESEARAAGHKSGDRVMIGGVSGTLTD